jgi:serine/threonine protein kinase
VSENFAAEASAVSVGFAAGSRVAGYVLEEQIGAGGMAVVFRARDDRLQRRVALKILALALAPDEAFRQRFIRESRAAAAVDDPHIIPVFEAGEAEGALFIAMRYVPGGDVGTLVRRAGQLSPGRALAIISPVASALDAAHGSGLIHRDVKPANMLVDVRPGRPDHVYLSDFGLSKWVMTSLGPTRSGQFLGTPGYSAPEQMEGKPADGRADQYSLGCAAFELLCGETPFRRDQVTAMIWAHMAEPPPMATSRRPDLPPGVDGVLAKALAKSPGDRYATCREFGDALREAFDLAPYDSDSGNLPKADRPWTKAPRPVHPGAVEVGIQAAAAISEAADGREAREVAKSRLPRKTAASRQAARSEPRHERAGQNAPFAPSSYPTPDAALNYSATETSRRPVWRPGEIPAEASNLKGRTGTRRGMIRRRLQQSRIRSRPVVLSLAALVAALGAVIGLVMTRSPSSPPRAPKPHLAALYAFPLQRYKNGLLIARRWTLGGKNGSQLTETIIARNATGKPIATWFQDSIPAGITSTVQAVRFRPNSVKIVHADPVVEWYLRVPAHGSVTVSYVTAVPPKGSTDARLAGWAKGLDTLEERLNTPAARHPRSAKPAASPTPLSPVTSSPAAEAPAPAPSTSNPYPFPTYSCDPSLVTCGAPGSSSSSSSSPSPTSGGL